MRIYHFTIIFAVFAAMMLLMLDFTISEHVHIQGDTSFLDEACDRAADAGTAVLAKAGKLGVFGVREAAVEAFYESLAASLNVAGYAGSRANLRMYVPMIVVADKTDMYVCYDEYVETQSGNMSLERKWSENIEGMRLEEVLQSYCDLHNEVAKRAGVKYEFTLPQDDGGLYLRGGDGTGFYVLFQGFTVEGLESAAYNRFSFAGTGLNTRAEYYINIAGTGFASPLYFHTENCKYRAEESTVYTARRDCALAGAFECPECGGDGY